MYSRLRNLLAGLLAVCVGTAVAMWIEAWAYGSWPMAKAKAVLTGITLLILYLLVYFRKQLTGTKMSMTDFESIVKKYGGVGELDNVEYPYLAVSTSAENQSIAFRDRQSATSFIDWMINISADEFKERSYVLAHLGAIWAKSTFIRPDDLPIDEYGEDSLGRFWPESVEQQVVYYPATVRL